MRRITILSLCILLSGVVKSQNDSIQLKSVVVSAEKASGIPGLNPVRIDSTGFNLNTYTDLANLLEYYSPVGIKNYGSNGAQTVTFRGMNASHTQVYVNGLNINSSSLGQTDLGTLPSFIFSDVQLKYGTSSMTEGIGALGGGVMLTGKNDRQSRGVSGLLGITLGSYGQQAYQGKIAVGGKKVQSETKVIYSEAQNNFSYRDITSPNQEMVEQTHAFGTTFGLSEALSYQINGRNQLYFFGWIVDQNKQLPALMIELNDSKEKQKDQQYGGQFGWDSYGNKSKSEFIAGYQYMVLDYSDSASGIASKTINQRLQFREDYTYNLGQKWALNLQGVITHNMADNPNYSSSKSQNQGWMKVGVNGSLGKKFETGLMGLLSVNNKEVDISPLLSLAYVPFEIKSLIISANLSQNVRYPSLNDLYWQPGGNENLKPEKSKDAELNVLWKSSLKKIKYDLKLTGFYGEVENWIQWVPTAFNYWSPENVKNVEKSGFETHLSADRQWTNWEVAFNGSYQYVKSVNKNPEDDSFNKQLIYTPEHSANWIFSTGFKKYFVHLTYRYVGERYISTDHSAHLPNYDLMNVALTKKFLMKKKKFVSLQAEVKNIFDKEYMSVAWRPMIGRNYSITLRYGW